MPGSTSERDAGKRIFDQWWIAVALITAMVSGMAIFSEHVALNGGFAWDGQFYGRFAADPAGMLQSGVDSYRLQRIAPAALVHGGVRLIGADPASSRVLLAGFHVLNCICIALAATLWLRIARVLTLGSSAYWLGVIALFVNFAVLKQPAYFGALVDIPALLLGMTALWAFVGNRPMVLLAVGLVTAFTWPVSVPTVAVLLLFPRRQTSVVAAASSRWLAAFIAGVAVIGVVGLFTYIYYVRGIAVVGLGPVIPVYGPLAPLSVAFAAAYIAIAIYGMTRPYSVGRAVDELRALRWWRVVLALALFIVPGFFVRALASGPDLLDSRTFAAILVMLGATRPLVAPVSHVAFFGPALLLLLPLWRPYLRAVHEWGPGVTLATLGAALLAMSPESRWSTFALPLVVAPLCIAAQRAGIPGRFVALLGAIALITSQFWLTINTSSPAIMASPGDKYRAVYARHFMNQGPYMSNAEYVVHAAVVAVVAVVLAIAWSRAVRPPGSTLVIDANAPAA